MKYIRIKDLAGVIIMLKMDSYALTHYTCKLYLFSHVGVGEGLAISFGQFSFFHIFHRLFFRGNKAINYFLCTTEDPINIILNSHKLVAC